MRKLIFLPALLALSGCAGTLALASPPTPVEVSTLAGAERSADLATQAAHFYVDNGKLSAARLAQINIASDTVHAALLALHNGAVQHQPLSFIAFNTAIATFNAATGK